tara:strand:+ start:376 stop:600 length:225 start_codon:yes stop_codon:yes gene_type:complete
MKYIYDVSEVYSYIKKWEVHSNKQLNEDDIQDICINYENRDYKSDNLIVYSFSDELFGDSDFTINNITEKRGEK